MRRFIILGLVGIIAAMVAGGVVVRSRHNASAYHNDQIQVGDINDDGHINFTGDVIALAKIAFGLQAAPTPYVIPPTPTPVPQLREAHVIIWWEPPASSLCCAYNGVFDTVPSNVVIDATRYPATATFRFHLQGSTNTGGTVVYCVRLVDLTNDSPVAGSEACNSLTVGPFEVITPAFSMAGVTERTYALQYANMGDNGLGNTQVSHAELIVNW